MKRKILASAVVAFILFLAHTSCTKIDTTDLGNDLIPAVDNVNTFETILNTITDNFLFVDDSTRMYKSQDHTVGIINNDPEFGQTNASLYAAFSPAAFGTHPFVKKDTVTIDSVVLSLTFKNLYGDSNSVQRFEAFEISASGDFKDSAYKLSNPDFPTESTILGNKLVDFKTLNDSIIYVEGKDTVRTKNVLRINLSTAFGQRFVSYDTTNAYKNDSIFKTLFKGLAIRVNEAASPSKSALAYFDLNDARTKITFHSRVQNNGKTDTIAPAFRYLSGAQANLVKRIPANSYLTYISNGNTNDDKIYLQSTPGSYATVKIPGIDTLANRVVHRAELIIEKLNSVDENIFPAPDLLFLDAINKTGDTILTIPRDFIYTASGIGYDLSIGGTQKNSRYVFNISRYIQDIVTNKKPNYTLRIYAPFTTQPFYVLPTGQKSPVPIFLLLNTPVAEGRVVLGGGSHPTNRMRLRIIYSKI